MIENYYNSKYDFSDLVKLASFIFSWDCMYTKNKIGVFTSFPFVSTN